MMTLSSYWKEDVRPAALKCVNERFLYLIDEKCKKERLSAEETAFVNMMINKTNDITGMKMINDYQKLIDQAFEKKDDEMAYVYVSYLYKFLLNRADVRDYYKDASAEYINLATLRSKLKRLMVVYDLMN